MYRVVANSRSYFVQTEGKNIHHTPLPHVPSTVGAFDTSTMREKHPLSNPSCLCSIHACVSTPCERWPKFRKLNRHFHSQLGFIPQRDLVISLPTEETRIFRDLWIFKIFQIQKPKATGENCDFFFFSILYLYFLIFKPNYIQVHRDV